MQEPKVSYFQKHLYFEKYPNSKEFQLDKCNKILEMIAKLKDRNVSIYEVSKQFHGTDSQGRIKTTEPEFIKFQRNAETISRLESYYNNCLSKLTKF
jgi:hypothetical protein